jgi:hypothetical protein
MIHVEMSYTYTALCITSALCVCVLCSLHATSFRPNCHLRYLTVTCFTLDTAEEFEMYVEFS